MSVVAPLKPPPQPTRHEGLEALIEEARLRARRRRVFLGFGALFAALVGVAIWGALALSGGGTSGTAPPGFRLIAARAPVEHELIETWRLPQPRIVDLATGLERPARTMSELWFDPKGGLTRILERVDGRLVSDRVEPCHMSAGPCDPGFPFETYWPPDARRYARVPGPRAVHGHEVVWLGRREHTFPPAPHEGQHIALDSQTHEPVAERVYLKGGLVSEFWVLRRMKDVPSFSFAVPKAGFGPAERILLSSPQGSSSFLFGARAAVRALGRKPLWLGWHFRGRPIRFVTIGVDRGLKFVRYDYGLLSVEVRAAGTGPQPGSILLEKQVAYLTGARPTAPGVEVLGETATLRRGGLTVTFTTPDPRRHPLTRASLRALAKALQPIPLPAP